MDTREEREEVILSPRSTRSPLVRLFLLVRLEAAPPPTARARAKGMYTTVPSAAAGCTVPSAAAGSTVPASADSAGSSAGSKTLSTASPTLSTGRTRRHRPFRSQSHPQASAPSRHRGPT